MTEQKFDEDKLARTLLEPLDNVQRAAFAHIVRRCIAAKDDTWSKERISDAIRLAVIMMTVPRRASAADNRFFKEKAASFHIDDWHLPADPHQRARMAERMVARVALENHFEKHDLSGELLARPSTEAGWQRLVSKWIKDHNNKT